MQLVMREGMAHCGRGGFLEERNRNLNPGSLDLMLRTHAVVVLHIPGQGPGNGDRVS